SLSALVPVMSDLKPPSHRKPGFCRSAFAGTCRSNAIWIPGRASIISNCGILFSLLDLGALFTVYTGFATALRGNSHSPAPFRRRRPLEHTTPQASQQPLGSAPAEQRRGPQNQQP